MSDQRWRVIPCGIDVPAFRDRGLRVDARASLGIDGGTIVIGNVGRLEKVKNQEHLVAMARAARALSRDIRFVIVGGGPLREHLAAMVRAEQLEDRVVFLGEKSDVASWLSAFDVFVFPSLAEGLPLAALEAQASGVPCLISDAVDSSVNVIPELVQFLSLSEPASHWLQEALRRASTGAASIGPADIHRAFVATGCEISESSRRVMQVYRRRLALWGSTRRLGS